MTIVKVIYTKTKKYYSHADTQDEIGKGSEKLYRKKGEHDVWVDEYCV